MELEIDIENYISFALLSVLVYEWVSVLPREIQHIWVGKWTCTDVMYLLCRYPPLIAVLLTLFSAFTSAIHSRCSSEAYASVWLLLFGFVVSELPFILRAYALWGSSRPAGIFLSFLVMGLASGLGMDGWKMEFAYAHAEQTGVTVESIESSPCKIRGISFVTLLCAIMILFVDAVAMGMVIWAAVINYRLDATNRLLRKVYHDSIIYFSLNFLFAAMAVALYVKTVGLAVLALRIGGVLRSTLASRMILELREYGNPARSFDRDPSDMTLSGSELSSLRFGSGGLGRRDEVTEG
ncbi:hypothetical protein P691DRAFT_433926 [Macrolepiota fuliginosa MF-IS2]|uniref:DUF6533 domain-containing protein n=1 Tax=Macrolepiota fuliginosa MF-IS2 TaxID=1400762 RepID=A0A9P5X2F3_9AGAR|nr:hypothetical protein P691DRAFT_433926 [Macrolepiota fuliginosa MF-IS2]